MNRGPHVKPGDEIKIRDPKQAEGLTLASGTGGSFAFNLVAAFSYSGASLLQCPHLQFKTK